MKLQRLTGLERDKIEVEYNELITKIADMLDILSKRSRILDIIKADCFYLREKFGDKRKTELAEGVENLDIEDLIQEEKVAVFFTKFGFVKRLAVDTFRTQLRGGRGIGGMVTREGDIIEKVVITSTHSYLVCFTSEGKCYKTKVYNIPEESRYSKGSSIKNVLNLKEEEKVTTGVVIEDFEAADQYYYDHNSRYC